MSKHTPGPWNTSAYYGGWDCIRDGSGQIIAKLGANFPANADLIAAAPDLLDALHGLLSITVDGSLTAPEQRDEVRAARDAIAKAMGS